MKGHGPLAGIRVIEIAGIGPAPFCGMLLADLGADVVVVDRPAPSPDAIDLGSASILDRGKRFVHLDLKQPDSVATVLDLIEHCDALIEGMRPGVMERLGLGPEPCLARNPALVFGRMTGWGQDGPLAQAAGHDINYIALSGALWYAGQPGSPPVAPPSLVGDLGGGALYLAVGLLAAILSARATGRGQVVDAAIVDGSAHLMNLLLSLKAAGHFVSDRGRSILDGPHWYATYRCADDRFVSVGSLEPRFYALLREKLGLGDDPDFTDGYDPARWPDLTRRFEALFRQRTREEWSALLEGSDACFAPVLDPDEAASHPHIAARQIYRSINGVAQTVPAPRFSKTPPAISSSRSADAHQPGSIVTEWRGC
ncbi:MULTISPECIES: CaiB/BaiF CoA transferase family protein [Bacteria]|jgi:crotonobetainyl-CoA:carnitine CoA-transferase CaiB-like acyl-CoA transferase|nr:MULTISPECIES: CaiB/BaiF CoA-transferase family protein [Bacteria]MDE0945308.1 CaiB/BaiF CoA-transferase family protein [Sphingobium sp.]OYW46662.1 MAG: CoA transferase [Novosphingobium sp. 12-63-9]OYX16990.1 MAG: CoA transferase [Sphingomonadales bacterium 32-67-7]PVE50772.1 CoA transferase [Arthrobacter sp. TPD3018]PVE51506.1 CoA transferase [Sphingomonas sp. TPD3009]